MANLEWDESMNLELLRLKAELSNKSFRPINLGLGLGELRPVIEKDSEMAASVSMEKKADFLSNGAMSDFQPGSESYLSFKNSKQADINRKESSAPYSTEKTIIKPVQKSSQLSQKQRVSRPEKRSLFYKYVKSHLIDMVFVTVTLAMAVCGFGWVVDDMPSAWDPQALRDWLPIRLLADTEPLHLLLGIYAVFLLYWLFFKLILGATIGQSLIRLASRSERTLESR